MSFSEALEKYGSDYITDVERKKFSLRLKNDKKAQDVLLSCYIPI